MADEKVRDILHRLPTRDVCGTLVMDRVGRRAWQRPRVAVSSRIYKQYRVPDPWDPTAKKDNTPIGLGPVSLRLGEERRQPAPHLKPKAPKQNKRSGSRDPLAGLPNIPKARKPKPAPSKAKTSASAPSREEKDAQAAEIAERMRAAEAARGGRWRRKSAEEKEQETESKVSANTPALPVRPDAEEAIRSRMPGDVVEKSDVGTVQSDRSSRGSTGRFRMQAKKLTNAPVLRRRAEERADTAEEKTEEIAPPPRRPMPTLGSGTMDDFFGAAAQMGRLAMPKRTDSSDPEGEE